MKVETRITTRSHKTHPYVVRVYVGGLYKPGATMECTNEEAAKQEAETLARAFRNSQN
jgi:hypothetical protein